MLSVPLLNLSHAALLTPLIVSHIHRIFAPKLCIPKSQTCTPLNNKFLPHTHIAPNLAPKPIQRRAKQAGQIATWLTRIIGRNRHLALECNTWSRTKRKKYCQQAE